MKRLREIGEVEVVREGANHTLVEVNGNRLTIPRHSEIGKSLSKKILKQARGER
jgi:predicted RNA binding protein YcfA (HicA-like mRNA interferase family)